MHRDEERLVPHQMWHELETDRAVLNPNSARFAHLHAHLHELARGTEMYVCSTASSRDATSHRGVEQPTDRGTRSPTQRNLATPSNFSFRFCSSAGERMYRCRLHGVLVRHNCIDRAPLASAHSTCESLQITGVVKLVVRNLRFTFEALRLQDNLFLA